MNSVQVSGWVCEECIQTTFKWGRTWQGSLCLSLSLGSLTHVLWKRSRYCWKRDKDSSEFAANFTKMPCLASKMTPHWLLVSMHQFCEPLELIPLFCTCRRPSWSKHCTLQLLHLYCYVNAHLHYCWSEAVAMSLYNRILSHCLKYFTFCTQQRLHSRRQRWIEWWTV